MAFEIVKEAICKADFCFSKSPHRHPPRDMRRTPSIRKDSTFSNLQGHVWNMLHSKCSHQLNFMFWRERFKTLTELGNFLPDDYHCTKCNVLHPVQPDDTPDLTNWNRRRRRSCFAPNTADDHLHPGPFYALMSHHVQLALKYSRMERKHQDLRTKILAKHEIRSVDSPIIKTFVARPKVINAKLILWTTYVLFARALQDAKIDHVNFISFCPQHYLGLGTGPDFPFAASLQNAAINAATKQDQRTELISCDHCSTDFSVAIHYDEAVIEVWSDLGAGLPLRDPSWQSHLYSEQNGLFQEMQFNYEHGNISKMYNSCNS